MKHGPQFLRLVEEVMPRIREISAEEVYAAVQSADPQPVRYIIIDVREDGEWAASHILGALHLGRGIIERDIENTVADKDAKLVLYCGGGYRSALAADSLQKM